MGLAMSVGALAFLRQEDPEDCERFRQNLVEVNRVLRANGLPRHKEPETLPELQSRFKHVGQPYGWFPRLGRAIAYAVRGHKKLKPMGRRKNVSSDPVYDNVLFSTDSHVVCHSDSEGFYVPIDFPNPLYDDLPDEDEHCIIGGILGSSQAVMRELLLVAPLLGIPVTGNDLGDKEFATIHNEKEEATAFWVERQVWLELFEAARLSIQFKTVISFG